MSTSIVKHISTLLGNVGLLMVLAITTFLGTTPLTADESDPSETYRPTLWRPRTLGVAVGSFEDDDDPLSILWVPHLTAGVRATRVAGAGGIALDDGTTGGAVAITAPGRRFAWTGGVGFLGDDDGTLIHGAVGVARPLGSRLSAGSSLGVTVVAGDDDAEVGLGIDVGARYRLPPIGAVARIELHAAMLDIGTAARREPFEPLIAPFTPYAGLRARLIETESLAVDASAAVRSESFAQTWIEAVGAINIARRVSVALGLNTPIGTDATALWPGISIGAAIPLGAAGTRASAAAQPTTDGSALLVGEIAALFPSTDRATPEARFAVVEPDAGPSGNETGVSALRDSSTRVYLAPISGLEQVVIEVHAEDDLWIGGIEAALFASDGTEVRRWSLQPLGEPTVSGDISERLTSDLNHRSFSAEVVWGVGDAPADGRYRLEVSAFDAADNRRAMPEIEIVVDRTPPNLSMSLDLLDTRDGESPRPLDSMVVSDDIMVDEDQIALDPDRELAVELRYDAAERIEVDVVDQAHRRLFSLPVVPEANGRPDTLTAVWSGQDETGRRLVEGVYRIRAVARDRIGNTHTVTSPPIIVRPQPARFRLALSGRIVSPNGDGVRDELTVLPELQPLSGLSEWNVALYRVGEDTSVREWSGIDLPPERLTLDRRVLFADGEYYLRGVARYRNGITAEDATERFLVDSVPPAVDLALSSPIVYPDRLRELEIFLEGDDTIAEGRLVLLADDGQEAATIREFGAMPESVAWELNAPDGSLYPPGGYGIYVEVADRAGNRSRSATRRFELTPRLEGADLVAQRAFFSPNGDGRFDDIVFAAEIPDRAGVGAFSLEIFRDGPGEEGAVRRFSGSLPAPRRIAWDGRDERGLPVEDGRYYGELIVTSQGRGEVRARSQTVTADTTPPAAGLRLVGPDRVSPDGDGMQDELSLRIDRGDASRVDLEVADASGGAPIALIEDLTDDGISWFPRTVDGRPLSDGEYRATIVAFDSAGNAARSEAVSFVVDTRPVGGFIRLSAAAISPNGDGIADVVTANLVIPDTAGLIEWRLTVVPTAGGRESFVLDGFSDAIPEAVRWPADGAADGEYAVRFTGRFDHGPVLDIESPPIVVDGEGPAIETSVSPQPFSPDGDGRDDTLLIGASVTDRSPIRYWLLEVFDPTGAFFYDVGGRGEVPERIRWDGRARNGERVLSAEEYPWRLEVADDLGNVSVDEGVIEVDVLVEPFDGGYRIQISSIVFQPNSAQLILSEDDERGISNRTVLRRLVEILGRFPDYSIEVEGHAVNITGTEREQETTLIPLSRARAEAVRAALIDAGIPPRLLTSRGRGGASPIVPHDDEENRWKNRRVDFILRR
ncbi:MAG: OmpA family protein [Spirochaetales bacterium]|nr:OmpA family protein [Spirochaetales bacterium]